MSDLNEVKFFREQLESRFADNFGESSVDEPRGAAVDAANMGGQLRCREYASCRLFSEIVS